MKNAIEDTRQQIERCERVEELVELFFFGPRIAGAHGMIREIEEDKP